MKRVLVIDDDQAILNYLNIVLMQEGRFQVTTLEDSEQACETIRSQPFDILLLDMDMPEVTGLDILRFLGKENITLPAIVLTGVEDVELAVSAMKLGAFDYLTKPVDRDHLLGVMQKALDHLAMKQQDLGEVVSLDSLEHQHAFEDIITGDTQMLRLFQIVEKIAQTSNSVLVWGESGTGKELIARAIHDISRRRDKKFIAVNAGVFANELFASEFFGHTKGAFSGAGSEKRGFLQEAHQGTLFLDEIGELSLPIQVKLLRVLQEGEFFPVGSTRNIKVDVRIIAATNKNLMDEVKRGNFRKDLFYRLNINSIYLPPLRDREGDILLLANHFLQHFATLSGKKIASLTKNVCACLESYDFPGNVRELMNIINSAVIVETNGELQKKSLPHYFLDNVAECTGPEEGATMMSLQEVQLQHIRRVLRYTDGNRTQAAKILGISRVSLINKIKQFGL